MPVKPLVPTLTPKQLNQIHAQLLKNPKPYALNQLLGVLTNSATPQNAFLLYNQMLQRPTFHNQYTFTPALKASTTLLHARQKGLEIHAHVLKSGHCFDIFIHNSLLHFYVVGNDIVSACRIFDSMSSLDVVSWTSIISGLSKCGFEEEAIRGGQIIRLSPTDHLLNQTEPPSTAYRLYRLIFGSVVGIKFCSESRFGNRTAF
jgi:pentatricopeptide repeat protein